MRSQDGWNLGAIAIFLSIGIITLSARTQLPPNRPTFFEDGYRRMEREIQQLEQPPTQPQDALLTIETDQLRWQQLLSRDGRFSVWIPVGISTTETKSVSTTEGTLTFEVFSTNQPNSRFIVSHATVAANPSSGQAESLFDQIRDYIVADTGFQTESDRPIMFKQSPGRMLTLAISDEKMIIQMYWIDDRIYVLGLSQQNTVDLSSAADRFFDSFQVLP